MDKDRIVALPDAARETLQMGDSVEVMLRKVMAAIMTNNRTPGDQVSRMDNSVDGSMKRSSSTSPS